MMRTNQCCVFLLTLLAGASMAYPAILILPNGEKIFNTGIDDFGATLSNGGIDTHYEFTLNPANSLTNPFVVSAGYLSANTSNSQWVGPVGAGVNAPDNPPGNLYAVKTIIDLTGMDLTGFRIDGFWISDNFGRDIVVNGLPTGQTNTGQHSSSPTAFADNAFSLSTGLVEGPNMIEYVWENSPFGPSNPTHVRIEFDSYAIVPEPTTLAIWSTLGGIGSLVCLRRPKRAAT